MKSKVNFTKILLAFLIATFLFFFGLFVGYLANQVIEKNTNLLLEETKNELFVLESLSSLQEDYPCEPYMMDKISEKLDSLGRIITILEEDKGLNDREVLELKKVYTLIQIKHFILINKLKENCNSNYTTILFFYSNEKECEKEVNEKSFIISFLRKKYDFIRVYSLDLNLNSEIIPFFKEIYGLKGCSEIVLNEKKIEESVETSNDLEKYLN